MKKMSTTQTASQLIDERIKALEDWRGALLGRLRSVVKAAGPDVVEEWKWDVPVWSCGGIICTGETYKAVVKLTFAKGASLSDPSKLFNSSLEGNTRRAIDFREGDPINEKALTALVRAAIALNATKPTSKPKPKPGTARRKAATPKPAKPKTAKPKTATTKKR